MNRSLGCVIGFVVSAMSLGLACSDEPATTGEGAPSNACTPLSDPATHVTSEAITTDGHYVVVLNGGSAARVFYGIATHLVEGAITKNAPGCASEVDFMVEGRSYVATLSPDPAHCMMIPSTLVSGDPGASTTVSLTVLTALAAPSSLSFYCS